MNRDERTKLLIERIRNGDKSAENELMEEYSNNVRLVAKKFDNVELEDAMQEGFIGLFKAIDRYEFREETGFWDYASFWVYQVIAKYSNEHYPIRVPTNIGMYLKRKEKGKEVDWWHEKQIDRLLHLFNLKDIDTLEDAEHPRYEIDVSAEILKPHICKCMEILSDREKRVIRLRYGFDGEPLTLKDTGKVLGVTRERIRQIEIRALRKMKYIATKQHLQDFMEE